MTTSPEPNPAPRLPLNRDRVLRAAVTLADRDGLPAVSMRRLGQELGVEAMSLYNHVANKDDILDGMVDIVFGEIGVPPEGDWRAAMRQRALAIRDVLARHPWAVGLLDSRRQPGPETLRHHDAVIGALRTGGFSIAGAAHAFSLLDSYIYGYITQQRSLPFATPEEVAVVAEDILRQFPTGMYPHMAEMILHHALRPGYDHGTEFEFGLDLILDALERIRSTA